MFGLREVALVCLCCALTCYGQNVNTAPSTTNLHNGLSEKIGNFSIELLYHAMQRQEAGVNLNMSPVTAWSLLAVVTEGASANTLKELCRVLRIVPSQRELTRAEFKKIFQWLQVNTNTVQLSRFNTLFVDSQKLPLPDFIDVAKDYGSVLVKADFKDAEGTSATINNAVAKATAGRITTILSSDDIANANLILTSVLYFKGQWTSPFNASMTTRQPFYSSTGEQIGEVNMMYNRFNYPFANIKALQARVLEMSYGKENRLSMLIMLPYPGVSLKDMFYNFNNVSLDTVFNELKVSTEEFGDDEVDCYLPRFKIESKIDLTDTLRTMGIEDLFDESKSRLPHLSRAPLYVTRVTHKAEIEVTEEGTTASAVTAAEFSNRISVIRFEVNRPFCYLIIEKTTNAIAFGGCYQRPSLF